MITREQIVIEARTWMGTRWHHQGRVKGVGVDCVGFVGGVAVAMGLGVEARSAPEAIPYKCYGRDPTSLFMRGCNEYMDKIDIKQAGVGDVLTFVFERDPQHLALITSVEPMYIIHAHAAVRKVVEHQLDDVWQRRVHAAYRLRGVLP